MKGTIFPAVLDLLFPPKCAFCGKLVEKGDLCEACKTSLPFREEEKATRLIGENSYLCAVALYYDGPAETGVKALKFGKKSWRAKVFARYIAQAAAEQLSGEYDIDSSKCDADRFIVATIHAAQGVNDDLVEVFRELIDAFSETPSTPAQNKSTAAKRPPEKLHIS